MTWRFYVHDSNNNLLKSEGGFSTEDEAQLAGGEYAEKLAASSKSQKGRPVYAVTVGREVHQTGNPSPC
jgi:hypothetical protein